MSQLQLYFLGPPEIRLDTRPLVFPTRKTLALLAYLALEPGPQAREQLAALLWPNATAARGFGSLRNTLGHLQALRRQVSDPTQPAFFAITHTTLALNPNASAYLDLHTVVAAYAVARADRSSRVPPDGAASLPVLQAAVTCQRGDFFAGFSLGDAPAFDEWVGIQREAWRRRLGLVLDRLSEIQFARGEFANTAETAARWIALDGLNEVAYRRKMRAHFAAGERGQALETYAACRALLAAELNVEPEPDTEALVDRIRAPQAPDIFSSETSLAPTPLNFLENLFAGRSAEQQTLSERYQRAAAGEPQVVVLSGEAGIGKTRLAAHFLSWATARGARGLTGGAFESSRRRPFQPWVDMLRNTLAHPPLETEGLPAEGLSLLTQLLPELRERYPDQPPAPANPAWPRTRVDQTELFEALTGFILAQAGHAPLILFLDDLQWADSASLEALLYALRRWRACAARILLLVGLRPEALRPLAQRQALSLSAWLTHIERELEACYLNLEPFSEPETLQLMLGLLAPPAPDFAQWVFNETRGHPFYLMETLKDLLERGALRPQPGPARQWQFGVDAEHDLGQAVRVPSTVRAVIRARLNRLSPSALALLTAGAVLEKGLNFERLCAVANLSAEAGLPALEELLSGRLLQETPPAGTSSAYVFTKDILREVVYTETGEARRRLFHQRALTTLMVARAPVTTLGHHALAAGVTQSAFHYSLTAAQEALSLAAMDEANTQLDIARQLAGEAIRAAAEMETQLRELYTQLGRAYEENGQPEQAAKAYAEQARLTHHSNERR